jgi:hypothetical protein
MVWVSHIKSSGNLQSIIIGSNCSNFSGVFDFIIIQYGTAVKIQQRGHSGKALEKKKYGGRNSGTETKIRTLKREEISICLAVWKTVAEIFRGQEGHGMLVVYRLLYHRQSQEISYSSKVLTI